MSLIELCFKGDLEGVKAALQSGADVNTRDEAGETGLMQATAGNHNSVVELLLNTPNIDVNLKSIWGRCALHCAVRSKNNEALKLLLDVPNIDVNIVDSDGESAVHQAVWQESESDSIEILKLVLCHPSLTALTLNHKDKWGDTAVMQAVRRNKVEHLVVLIADPRVDLETSDEDGRSLEEVARWVFSSILKIVIK